MCYITVCLFCKKCRIGLLTSLLPHMYVVAISFERNDRFVAEDAISLVRHGPAFRYRHQYRWCCLCWRFSDNCLKGHRDLYPKPASRLWMICFDNTGLKSSDTWCRIDDRDTVDVDVTFSWLLDPLVYLWHGDDCAFSDLLLPILRNYHIAWTNMLVESLSG